MAEGFHLAIIFEENTEKAYINNVCDLLSTNFTCKTINITPKVRSILLMIKNNETILHEAEAMLIYKNLSSIQNFPKKTQKKGFGKLGIMMGKSKIDEMLGKISVNALNDIDERILRFNERDLISLSYINSLEISESEKSRLKKEIVDLINPAEMLKIHYYLLTRINLVDHRMIEVLSRKRIIHNIVGLHTPYNVKGSYQKVREYFGEKIAIYIHFLRFYKRWMIFPLILSIIVMTLEYFSSNLYFKWWNSLIFSFLMIFWANTFVISWNRYCSELSIEWNTYGKIFDLHDRNNKFCGVTQVSPITGLIEMKFSSKKRFFYYCCSALEALPYLFLAFLIKIVYLNALGFINVESKFLFHSSIKSNIPDHKLSALFIEVLHVVSISKLNKFYKIVNDISTQRENHKSKSKMRNSYIFKCFIFEFINRFLHFIYLAFIKQDLDSLSSSLLSFCIVDQLRRVGVESFLPLINKFVATKKNKKEDTIKHPPEAAASNPTKELWESEVILEDSKIFKEKVMELKMNDYEVDDDYLDIVFQFSTLLLFCSIFKVSGIFCFISNLIEFESDTFKLQNKLYKRGIPETANNIGVWLVLINFFIFFSVYTNSFLLIFYLEQIGKTHSEDFYLVGYAIQQLMIFVLIIMKWSIKYQPYWVRVFLKRKKYKLN